MIQQRGLRVRRDGGWWVERAERDGQQSLWRAAALSAERSRYLAAAEEPGEHGHRGAGVDGTSGRVDLDLGGGRLRDLLRFPLVRAVAFFRHL